MGRVVLITLSDYRAIMQWDEDGGKSTDLTYEIASDLVDCSNKTPEGNELEPGAGGGDDSLPRS